MRVARTVLVEFLARQYAWNLHRFGEDSRQRTEATIGFIAIVPAIGLGVLLGLTLMLLLPIRQIYLLGAVLCAVCWFAIQRHIHNIFQSEHEAIRDAAVKVLEDPARGPRWAAHRQLVFTTVAMLIVGFAVVIARMAAIQLDVVANPKQFQHLADASRYLRANETGLNRIADRFAQDTEVVELICEPNLTDVDSEFFGRQESADEYLDIYEHLCKSVPKITARRTARGVQFPYAFYEHGSLFVQVFLERRQSANDTWPECRSTSFETPKGRCEVLLRGNWSVAYSWEPY